MRDIDCSAAWGRGVVRMAVDQFGERCSDLLKRVHLDAVIDASDDHLEHRTIDRDGPCLVRRCGPIEADRKAGAAADRHGTRRITLGDRDDLRLYRQIDEFRQCRGDLGQLVDDGIHTGDLVGAADDDLVSRIIIIVQSDRPGLADLWGAK